MCRGLSRGSHSTLYVAANPTSPSLFPLSLGSTDQSGHVVIGCLVRGFFPSAPMNVTWSHSGEAVSTRNFPPVQAADGSLYSMTSQLTLPAAQCSDGATKTCHVQHNSNFNKAVEVPCKVKGRAGRCGQPHSHGRAMFPTGVSLGHKCTAWSSRHHVAWRSPLAGTGGEGRVSWHKGADWWRSLS